MVRFKCDTSKGSGAFLYYPRKQATVIHILGEISFYFFSYKVKGKGRGNRRGRVGVIGVT